MAECDTKPEPLAWLRAKLEESKTGGTGNFVRVAEARQAAGRTCLDAMDELLAVAEAARAWNDSDERDCIETLVALRDASDALDARIRELMEGEDGGRDE